MSDNQDSFQESQHHGADVGHTASTVSGSAGDVVQAGYLHGGVHFHKHGTPAGPIPRQLPVDTRIFVNRAADLKWLDDTIDDIDAELRFGTVGIITGTAGVGKTSLAVHWSHRVRERFPDGQLHVDLRGYDPGSPVSAMQALERLLRALDVAASAIPAELEARASLYRSLLAERRILVLLDNAANVSQVRPLLPGTVGCLVLITSRSRLSGLVAREGAYRRTLRVLSEPEAIDLVRATIGDYRSTDNVDDIAELARLCARLPLALRIAAERASSQPQTPLGDLIRDLRDESSLWDMLGSDDDADAVRAVFAWSYRALSEDAAKMFRLLGLHPGPEFELLAAAALAGSRPQSARHVLDILTGVHLLEQPARDRYQFHDLLRAYAGDQAHNDESVEGRRAALQRMLLWYLHSLDAAVTASDYQNRAFPLDPPGPDITPASISSHNEAIEWYEKERTNLVAAVVTAQDLGSYEIAWRLSGILRSIYIFRHPFDDWLMTGRIGLDSARRIGDRFGEAYIMFSLGMAHMQRRQPQESLAYFEQSSAIQQEIGDRLGESQSLTGQGQTHLRLRQLTEAQFCLENAHIIAHELGVVTNEAFILHVLGHVYIELNQPERAADHLARAIGMLREIDNRAAEIDASLNLSEAQRELGHIAEAETTIRRTLEMAADAHDDVATAYAMMELGRTQLADDHAEESLVSFQQAAILQRQLGNPSREGWALDGAGQAYQRLQRFEDAADFHRRAVTIQRTVGDDWWLSVALDNLGAALRHSGEMDAARSCWAEAASLLARFSDPKSDELRNRVEQQLASELPDRG